MKLWHCSNSRSFRPLWALEELNLSYELEIMPFPPRTRRSYLRINPLGTVPYFVDGNQCLTESTAICQYLVETYGGSLGMARGEPDYGAYLNWLHYSDATITFPQTIYLRYGQLEIDNGTSKVAQDYRKWYLARLKLLNSRVENHEFLAGERFTVADIACAYALYLGELLDIAKDYKSPTMDYLERMKQRPGFQRALQAQEKD